MKTLLLIALTATAALAETSGTWTGTITDSMCLKDHTMTGNKGGDDACAKACVKASPASVKYVLYDGKNVYKLSDQKLPEQYAAKKVVIKGTLYAKTGIIKVESIQPAK